MSTAPLAIFLDTCYMRKVPFRHPDFQKLIEYSRQKRVRLYVSFIAWEERRTQLLDETMTLVNTMRANFEKLRNRQPNDLFLQGLPAPDMWVWDDGEIGARSREKMIAFAAENHITIIPLGVDHAGRAWDRYFRTDPPFDASQKSRTERRKDIPDSWILEAAIDLKGEHTRLIALSSDIRFTAALRQVLSIEVFTDAQPVFDLLDVPAQVEVKVDVHEAVEARDSVAALVETTGALGAALSEAEAQFRLVGTKIIGLVTYLSSPTKEQVSAILERSGIPSAISKNVAERLALAKIIIDTGNHYISGDKAAGEQARAEVEAEIIRIVSGD